MNEYKCVEIDISNGESMEIGHCVDQGEFFMAGFFMDVQAVESVIDVLTKFVKEQKRKEDK